MSWLINRYNKKTSKKYGWSPSWFGKELTSFNSSLIEAVRRFQFEHGLSVDGKVGPMTYRRILSSRDLEEDSVVNYILINDQKVEIDWDVKINISTHFCIDNDGIIHQYVDTNNTAWHAGGVNKRSIGVDFSNAYYLKYANYYKKKGYGERPICEDSVVHGVRLKPHLGYYKVQIEAYKKLLALLCKHYDINLDVPRTKEGDLHTGVAKDVARGRYNGVVCHYHVTRGKIDCAGLELAKIVNELN